jgi:galactofuranosylgalactofuranosylrhamnosyl-N-acetylglucosaminyl-diphospho-decaprenol beta-1,5/1,6-galactofuranosyltransferase
VVYIEIRCLSEQGSFVGGSLTTDQPKNREISLGIVTCTFRKEVYVKKTVSAISRDELLQNKSFKVFIVDNGRTLKEDDFQYENLQIISNKNVGGSGGFTRGLIEALQEDIYTHFLFMDDDIELETESIYRLFPLYEYAKHDFSIAGSMLDLYKKHVLYEAGAMYAKGTDASGNYQDCPFGVVCLNSKLNLENSATINLLLSEQKPDYGGFWFFSFSQETVQAIGLPLPLFIKIDDMEFGLRIKERLGNEILYFPSIAIWHEPFYAKHPGWDMYYEFRNHMITHSIRASLNFLKAAKFLTKAFIYQVFIFDYNSAEMILKSVEDYLQGPELLTSHDPELFHSKILQLSKSHKTQTLGSKALDFPEKAQYELMLKHSKNNIKRIFALLTLNGHLLPKFILSADEAIYCVDSNHVGEPWYNIFGKRRVVILREGNNKIFENEMSSMVGISLLIRWLLIIAKAAIRWSSVSADWRNSFDELTSMEFWKKYLKLDKEVEVKKEGATFSRDAISFDSGS